MVHTFQSLHYLKLPRRVSFWIWNFHVCVYIYYVLYVWGLITMYSMNERCRQKQSGRRKRRIERRGGRGNQQSTKSPHKCIHTITTHHETITTPTGSQHHQRTLTTPQQRIPNLPVWIGVPEVDASAVLSLSFLSHPSYPPGFISHSHTWRFTYITTLCTWNTYGHKECLSGRHIHTHDQTN